MCTCDLQANAKKLNSHIWLQRVSVINPFLSTTAMWKWKSFSHVQLCNPMDCSLPGFSLRGILQARILEWVAIPFSRESSQPRDWPQVSCIGGRFFTVWVTMEAPPQLRLDKLSLFLPLGNLEGHEHRLVSFEDLAIDKKSKRNEKCQCFYFFITRVWYCHYLNWEI